MKRTEILSHNINYRDIGKGDIVILVHGFGGGISDWDEVADELSRNYRVIIPSLTALYVDPDRPVSFSQQVTIFKEFLRLFKKFQTDKITVVGSSFGASLCYCVAIEDSHLINKLILVSPMPPAPQTHVKNPLIKYALELGKYPPALAAVLLTPMGRFALPQIQKVFNASWLQSNIKKKRLTRLTPRKVKLISHVISRFYWINATEDWSLWRTRMSFIAIPIHIVWGGRDALFSDETYSELAKIFPHATSTRVYQAGHVIMKEAPKDIIEIIESFMTSGHPTLNIVSQRDH